ncbi:MULTISPECIES: VOC family protein [Pseudomonas aeruginosa group]|uniref:VOC family protein n=1 Tax=Pseudomonas aeruginosa group TaxID=136841 RepID=UPI001A24A70D|nr:MULTISPECIES: VOC family protein [Pseudomonas aeruginosa group]MBG6886136.1 VOC family protein [Pseudomonas aeruginosa]MCY0315500.1 VOC family protein [Pseudomonas aeruginosa]MCY0517479.1 VOC family protein [Pseudomonas aeruginosa]MDI3610676.1 VOC family protein [Pseudomonas aeruginosa]MDI3677541.1 VOC family protein [Pseudomonas aeruginosa]
MPNDTTLCFCTLAVPDLVAAEAFYVDVLGLRVSRRYAATVWISLDVDEQRGAGLGLIEDPAMARPSTKTMIDLQVDDLDQVFNRLATRVEVIEPPVRTGWGSYKATIQDPFGNRLGLVARG